MAKQFLEKYTNTQHNSYSFVVDADGRVAYIYFLYKDQIIADVWLKNQILVDDNFNFKNQLDMPFCNLSTYIDSNFQNEEIKFTPKNYFWNFDPIKQQMGVLIEFNNGVLIILEEDSKIGWSNAVVKDGPLAKKITTKKLKCYIRKV